MRPHKGTVVDGGAPLILRVGGDAYDSAWLTIEDADGDVVAMIYDRNKLRWLARRILHRLGEPGEAGGKR
jgi:hypothetical protein